MIVGHGDKNLLLIAICEDEVIALQGGHAITYEGCSLLTKDILVMYGRDKAHVLALLDAAGIAITPVMREKYLNDERTDAPRRPS